MKEESFSKFVRIVAALRAIDGCPWDREQTHGSLKAACVEEAAEVLGAINCYEKTGRGENLKEELGDLLMQVVLQAQIAEEEGLFTIEDVIEGISTKMLRRHPHVFGPGGSHEGEFDTSHLFDYLGEEEGSFTREGMLEAGEKERLSLWEEMKKREKAGKDTSEEMVFLKEAFLEAEELIERAKRRKGFIGE